MKSSIFHMIAFQGKTAKYISHYETLYGYQEHMSAKVRLIYQNCLKQSFADVLHYSSGACNWMSSIYHLIKKILFSEMKINNFTTWKYVKNPNCWEALSHARKHCSDTRAPEKLYPSSNPSVFYCIFQNLKMIPSSSASYCLTIAAYSQKVVNNENNS